jgi:histidine triad (HIT) family protein
MAECIFCSIVAGDIPAQIVAETEHTLAFRDISPKAPTHILVIPRNHETDIAALAAAAPEVAAELLMQTRTIATAEGHSDYRLIFNSGADAGQTVLHAHGHVLAGGPIALGFE